MNADIMAMRMRYIDWVSRKQTPQVSSMPQAFQARMPLSVPQPIQPIPAPQPSDERKAIEWLWNQADPDGLKLFKLAEKMIESPYPLIRVAGGLIFLASLFKTADTLDKKLDH